MIKISNNLKIELYSNINEDINNPDTLIYSTQKENNLVKELNKIYINGDEFDLQPFKHLRIISMYENTTNIEYTFVFDIPVILRGKNDRLLFKKFNIENFIRKNKLG